MSKVRNSILTMAVFLAAACGIAWFAWHDADERLELTHDFGVVPINVFKDHILLLSNAEKTPVKVEESLPLCTCLRVLEAPREIPPLSQARVVIRYTPEKPGPSRADVRVVTVNAGGARQQTDYHFAAEVIPQPEALPSSELLAKATGWLKQGIIRPAAAAVAEKPEDHTVIDLRPSTDFQTATAAGAMNLPLAALSTLPASLREKPVWLLDRGIGAEAAITEVQRLQNSGWNNLHVIEGGLAGWRATGGPVAGSAAATVPVLTSSEARTSATRPGWITVVPDTLSANWKLKELFPDRLTFDARMKAEEIAEKLAKAIESRRPGEGSTTTVLHVLVATESGENAEMIAESLQSKGIGTPVFVLGGGLRGYLDHLRTLRPEDEHRQTTLADYRGVLADLRARQRLVASCSSCSRH